MAIGKKTGGGSRKGVPNKVTQELKGMILGALDKAGGENYLYQQALENPASFMTLLGKVLPSEIKAKVDASVSSKVEYVAEIPRRG